MNSTASFSSVCAFAPPWTAHAEMTALHVSSAIFSEKSSFGDGVATLFPWELSLLNQTLSLTVRRVANL
ncbi:MAG: hypothetical protein ACI3YC_04720, partial [Alloprevotella sp.]